MKTTELMNAWIENSKAAFEPARELGELTKSTLTKMGEQQMAVAREYMEFSVRGMQAMSVARDPRTLASQQVEMMKELGEKMMANAEAYTKLATETQAAFAGWAEKTTEAAVAKAEQAVEKAA